VKHPLVSPEFGSFLPNSFPSPCQHFQVTPNLRSERSKIRTLSTFAYTLCFSDCPLLGSSCTPSRPSLNRPRHWRHSISSCRIYHKQWLMVLLGLNKSLARFDFIRFSRSLSRIFPLTSYHGHVLLQLLLGNERLIWSLVHINATWNVSKRAWVHEFAWLNIPATRRGIPEI
jgi:hypothetical protein